MATFQWSMGCGQRPPPLRIKQYTQEDFVARRARQAPTPPRRRRVINVTFDAWCGHDQQLDLPLYAKQLMRTIERTIAQSRIEPDAVLPLQVREQELRGGKSMNDEIWVSGHNNHNRDTSPCQCHAEALDDNRPHGEKGSVVDQGQGDELDALCTPLQEHAYEHAIEETARYSFDSEPQAPASEVLHHTRGRSQGPWSAELNSLLLELKDEAQLPWTAILDYFPGRSKGAISQHYSRIKGAPAVHCRRDAKRASERLSRLARGSARGSTQIHARVPAERRAGLRKYRQSSPGMTVKPAVVRKPKLQPLMTPSVEELGSSKSGRRRFRPRHHAKDGYS